MTIKHACYRILLVILANISLGACHLGVTSTPSSSHIATTPAYAEQQVERLENLVQNQQVGDAQALLAEMDTTVLAEAYKPRLQIATARLYLLENNPRAALTTLGQVESPDTLPIPTQAALFDVQATAQDQTGDKIVSVKTRVYRDPLLNNSHQKQQNEQALWATLQSIDSATLSQQATQDNLTLRGWIEVALIEKLYANGSQEKQDAQLAWQMQYPTHPAQNFLFQTPSAQSNTFIELNNPSSPTSLSPTMPIISGGKRVALLLPTTGSLAPSANAIQAGLVATYETEQAQGVTPLNINIYDTHEDNKVTDAYQTAIATGNEFVIGPLSKNGVEQLQAIKTLHTPTLALNYTATTSTPPFYQFGLAPEDEIAQVTKQAQQDGHRGDAIIVAPANNWGARIAAIFSEKWQSQGGSLLTTFRYPPEGDLTASIEHLVKNNGFNDPSANTIIFLVATPTQARQIKPLLNFNLADALPVYATSSIYMGVNDPTSDGDLNDIVFCDTPWTLAPNTRQQNIKESIAARYPQSPASLTRLYALGVDSYDLINHLAQLKQTPYQGATGQLFIDNQGRIARNLPCARFVGGIPKVLSAAMYE